MRACGLDANPVLYQQLNSAQTDEYNALVKHLTEDPSVATWKAFLELLYTGKLDEAVHGYRDGTMGVITAALTWYQDWDTSISYLRGAFIDLQAEAFKGDVYEAFDQDAEFYAHKVRGKR